MITGNIKDITTYKGLGERINKAIDYILSFDKNTKDGRYYIDGENLFANVVTIDTKEKDGFSFEAHRKYLDLQYILSGSEKMIYSQLDDCTDLTEYCEENDVLFAKGKGSEICVGAGDFYLVHPFDAHAPGIRYNDDKVRKVIVKIKI